MMVAVALLSIISIAALQLVRTTETDIVGSQVTLGNQQKK
jgi:type II secretory pathway component PulJ